MGMSEKDKWMLKKSTCVIPTRFVMLYDFFEFLYILKWFQKKIFLNVVTVILNKKNN